MTFWGNTPALQESHTRFVKVTRLLCKKLNKSTGYGGKEGRMFKITVDSSVQEALARAFPTPSSAAARALDKYVKAL